MCASPQLLTRTPACGRSREHRTTVHSCIRHEQRKCSVSCLTRTQCDNIESPGPADRGTDESPESADRGTELLVEARCGTWRGSLALPRSGEFDLDWAWSSTGRFDENIFPAYLEDREMEIREQIAVDEGTCSPPHKYTSATLEHGLSSEYLRYVTATTAARRRTIRWCYPQTPFPVWLNDRTH